MSEIRRKEQNDMNFRRCHNRKFAKTPDAPHAGQKVSSKERTQNSYALKAADNAGANHDLKATMQYDHSQKADQTLQQDRTNQNSMA